ncbi:hypothetical protein RHMOL_Rhmol12G0139000 [Rhododendron molle]|uniref:Uncharacterized protein n=1 Tax=Rhododendron molle TaxID=49168 RepID=A0ACC0LHU7_RHOML|nr:hypothetical protein RHMOL_Rhmol12G0139000 [Rhododendron molle]
MFREPVDGESVTPSSATKMRKMYSLLFGAVAEHQKIAPFVQKMIPNGCSVVIPNISPKAFNSKSHFSGAYGGIPLLPSCVSYRSIRSSWKSFQGLTLQSSIDLGTLYPQILEGLRGLPQASLNLSQISISAACGVCLMRFVEIMAPVFSRDTWRCVWHMIPVQNIIFREYSSPAVSPPLVSGNDCGFSCSTIPTVGRWKLQPFLAPPRSSIEMPWSICYPASKGKQVDMKVRRIAVKLGWVPLQPLPESLQLHLQELYELHYQMITFGKSPSCSAAAPILIPHDEQVFSPKWQNVQILVSLYLIDQFYREGFRFCKISWFQFLPHESDLNPLPDNSCRRKDFSVHGWIHLLGLGIPEGVHNPDEKIKLWLFLPGRYASVIEFAQAAVSRLRACVDGNTALIGSIQLFKLHSALFNKYLGKKLYWFCGGSCCMAPGDSEEVASALSQALRNRIERALNGLSYMRFGDAFSKYQPLSPSEELFRRGQPVVEFIFAATEEAIFVHVLMSAKHIRELSSCDMEKIQNDASNYSGDRLPGLLRDVSQVSGSHLNGQSCYVEVTLGFPSTGDNDTRNSNLKKSLLKHQDTESSAVASGVQKGLHDQFSVSERTFIYPVEAVIVPVLQTSFARSCLKSVGERDSADGSWTKANIIRSEQDYHSSSNSISCSISSISGTSSDSDCQMAAGVGELDADADSLTSR